VKDRAASLLLEVRSAGARFAAAEAAAPERYPSESVAELIALGVFSAPFLPSLGGRGQDLVEGVAVVEALAEASPSLALLAAMPLGLAGVLAGAEPAVPEAHRAPFRRQVADVAADYREGRIYAACNSERGAGGSIAAIQTVAVRDDGGRYRLTGDKILASFGRYASVFFSTAKLPDGGVEFFLVDTSTTGVAVRSDWDGFGMRSTESHSVRYQEATARALLGFPGFIDTVQPLSWWYCLFAAIPLGCAASMIRTLSTPTPSSPALRLRLSEALMRYEAARAYLVETAAQWRPGADAPLRARMLRAKTHVTQEATRIAGDLFALSGGRHYRRSAPMARALAGAFAGTALRPPLPLGLDLLVDGFSLDGVFE
jgi:alkylation response protein AidB-like acyl-CoA dehydrogenase